MNVTFEKAIDLDELSLFLSEINQHKKSNIGYCGEKVEEILLLTCNIHYGNS